MKLASGVVAYRHSPGGLGILIVHPSGTYNRHGAWSIPKGTPNPVESLEDAARRETFEETGIIGDARHPLGSVTYQKSRKQVHAFATEVGRQVPSCASLEIDHAEFVSPEVARQRLHPNQQPLVDRLLSYLAGKI